jgi:hypothetical protein
VEPDLPPHEEGDIRVGRKTGAAQEAERRRVRRPGTAIFTRPPILSAAPMRAHAGTLPRAARVEANRAPPSAARRTSVLR